MANKLKRAYDSITAMPTATQERIGEELLLHVEKVRRLRSKLESAAHALDHGGGRELKITKVIDRARAQYGEAK
jgi:hypothetical protein